MMKTVELQEAFDHYIALVQQKEKDYYEQMGFTNLTPDRIVFTDGKRYIRVIKESVEGTSRSVHTFIDKNDGSIYKAASWKAPAKGIRGSIASPDNGASVVTWHGAVYLR